MAILLNAMILLNFIDLPKRYNFADWYNFAERYNIAYWLSCIEKGLRQQAAHQAC